MNFQSPHATEAIIPELLRTVWEEHQPQGKDAVMWELMQQGSVSGDSFIKIAYEARVAGPDRRRSSAPDSNPAAK